MPFRVMPFHSLKNFVPFRVGLSLLVEQLLVLAWHRRCEQFCGSNILESCSEKGIVYSTRAYQIPECSPLVQVSYVFLFQLCIKRICSLHEFLHPFWIPFQILPIPPGERITSVKSVSSFKDNEYLVMLTARGFIKRTSLATFSTIRSSGIVAIQLVSKIIFFFIGSCTKK